MKKFLKFFDDYLLYGIVVLVIAILIFSVTSMIKIRTSMNEMSSDVSSHQSIVSFSAPMTPYDIELAKKFMDKDGDGRCDVCGMDVETCIQSGQIQCSMDPSSTIGPLDTSKKIHHYHADFKVYINGQEVDFNQQKYFVKSRFNHIENDPQGDSGKVIHMHADGVPLWLFFGSLGLTFDKECFTLDNGQSYCSDGKNTLKLYVNGQKNSQYGEYVFQDNDKILISFGSENDDELKQQINSVTDYGKNH